MFCILSCRCMLLCVCVCLCMCVCNLVLLSRPFEEIFAYSREHVLDPVLQVCASVCVSMCVCVCRWIYMLAVTLVEETRTTGENTFCVLTCRCVLLRVYVYMYVRVYVYMYVRVIWCCCHGRDSFIHVT